MDPALKALLRRNFLSFARKAIRELEGTKLGDEPYLAISGGRTGSFRRGKDPSPDHQFATRAPENVAWASVSLVSVDAGPRSFAQNHYRHPRRALVENDCSQHPHDSADRLGSRKLSRRGSRRAMPR